MSFLRSLRRAKLGPLTLLLLLGGLLAIAYAGMGVSILREQRDQQALASQIDGGEGALSAADQSRRELENLEARLSTAEQELAFAEAAYPSELDSSAVLETVLAHANESRVRVLKVDSQPPTTVADETATYSVLSLKLDVEGNFIQLAAFLAALEGGLSASRTGDFTLEKEGERYTLNLEVLTYARSATDEDPASEAVDGPSDAAGEGQEAPEQ